MISVTSYSSSPSPSSSASPIRAGTHDNQNGSLPGDIGQLSRSLAAFQADLEARGIADRVLVHVWSEFGRRAEENGGGTDHGAGGVSLVMGTQAAGGTRLALVGHRLVAHVDGHLVRGPEAEEDCVGAAGVLGQADAGEELVGGDDCLAGAVVPRDDAPNVWCVHVSSIVDCPPGSTD